MTKTYIKSAAWISAQLPLCDAWMETPLPLAPDGICAFRDPDWKQFVSPLEARRMTGLMKRALAVSATALKEAGISVPDAVIFGTGLGLQENSEAFLKALCLEGRTSLHPVHFMQSTHNTLASLIGIRTGSHGYNATYSHAGLSFQSALEDAWTQLCLSRADNVLVGAFDEVTPFSAEVMRKTGRTGEGLTPAGLAAAFVLDKEPDDALCELSSVRIMNRPSPAKMRNEVLRMLSDNGLSCKDLSFVMSSTALCDGSRDDDYAEVFAELFGAVPSVSYGHISGECFSSPAAGLYMAVSCIRHGIVPDLPGARGNIVPENVILYNRSLDSGHSFILLRVCGK